MNIRYDVHDVQLCVLERCVPICTGKNLNQSLYLTFEHLNKSPSFNQFFSSMHKERRVLCSKDPISLDDPSFNQFFSLMHKERRVLCSKDPIHEIYLQYLL